MNFKDIFNEQQFNQQVPQGQAPAEVPPIPTGAPAPAVPAPVPEPEPIPEPPAAKKPKPEKPFTADQEKRLKDLFAKMIGDYLKKEVSAEV